MSRASCDASIGEGVARRMVDRRIHRILVIEDEKLVGIISSLDLIRRFAGGKVS